jgi:cytosine/adenosine deaminase-related metal-dependent hydrolase
MTSIRGILALSLVLSTGSTLAANPLVIEHVSVIPMVSRSEVLKDMTVVIHDGRISEIRRSAGETAHSTSQVIDGRGKWLIPGLADMHVHVENVRMARLYLRDPAIPRGSVETEDALLPYVANGVLQVAALSAMSETLAQREEVETGRALGPHIAAAAMIDGEPPLLPFGVTRVAVTPEEGRQAVRDAIVEGYDLIKVYSRLTLPTFLAIVDEARKQNIRVIGHLPGRNSGNTGQLFVPGFGMVAHAEEFAMQSSPADTSKIAEYAALAKKNGTWLATTLTLDTRILEQMRDVKSLANRADIAYLPTELQGMVLHANPYARNASADAIKFVEQVIAFNTALIKEFDALGVPIVAATDALNPGVVPGFSLHDELEEMARAGMTNAKILESATRLPAEWLGTAGDRGTVAVGKRADLVLLDADPLRQIANTRRIAAVIVNGRYLPRAELDSRMEKLRAKRAIPRGDIAP